MISQLYLGPGIRRVEIDLRPAVQAQHHGIPSGVRLLGLGHHGAGNGLLSHPSLGGHAHHIVVDAKPAQPHAAAQGQGGPPPTYLPEQAAAWETGRHGHPLLPVSGVGHLPARQHPHGGKCRPHQGHIPRQQQTSQGEAACKPRQFPHI